MTDITSEQEAVRRELIPRIRLATQMKFMSQRNRTNFVVLSGIGFIIMITGTIAPLVAQGIGLLLFAIGLYGSKKETEYQDEIKNKYGV